MTTFTIPDKSGVSAVSRTADVLPIWQSGAQHTATPEQVVQAVPMVGDSGAGGSAGVVPAPTAGDAAAGKFLKADGSWEVAGGAPGGSTGEFQYNNNGALGGYSAAQAAAALPSVVGDTGSGGTKGLVPAPSAGDAAAGKFLKADGSWAAAGAGAIGRTVTANATIAASDMNTTILVNSASDVVITVDTNANVPVASASYFEIINIGTGTVLLVAASGVTFISRGVGGILPGAGISVLRLATDSWHVAGDMSLSSGIVYQRNVAKSADQNTTHTFSNVTLGAAQGNRKLIFHVATIASVWGTIAQISSVTVNGVAATIRATDYNHAETGAALAIVSADIPEGSTATIVVNCTAIAWCCIASYAIYTNGAFAAASCSLARSSTATVSTTAVAGDLIISGGWTMRDATSGDDAAGFSLSQVASGTFDLSYQDSFPLNMRLYSKSINGAAAGTVTATSTSVMSLASASIIRWSAA